MFCGGGYTLGALIIWNGFHLVQSQTAVEASLMELDEKQANLPLFPLASFSKPILITWAINSHNQVQVRSKQEVLGGWGNCIDCKAVRERASKMERLVSLSEPSWVQVLWPFL